MSSFQPRGTGTDINDLASRGCKDINSGVVSIVDAISHNSNFCSAGKFNDLISVASIRSMLQREEVLPLCNHGFYDPVFVVE